MISLKVTLHEIAQFQNILPVQGNIKTLELVESILQKIENIQKEDISNEEIEMKFSSEEFFFMKEMIVYLDNNKQLSLFSLSLIKKILLMEKNNE